MSLWNNASTRIRNELQPHEVLNSYKNIYVSSLHFTENDTSPLQQRNQRVLVSNYDRIILAVGKQEVLHSECVSVGLVTQYAKRMRLIIFLSVACLVVPYFYSLSHK
jgi:hypothetical protein